MAKLRDPVKPESGVKYEHFVEQKLAEARGRIRTLDLTAGFLGLLVAIILAVRQREWGLVPLAAWLTLTLLLLLFYHPLFEHHVVLLAPPLALLAAAGMRLVLLPA